MKKAVFSDFESLYARQIMPALASAEQVRKKILLNYWIIGTVAFAGFIFEAITWMAIGVAVIILFIILYTRWYSIPASKFERLYEEAITKNIVNHISPSLHIDRNSHLALSELNRGLIITGTPQHFGGSYLIEGEPDGIPIRISEINSSTKHMPPSGQESIQQNYNGLVAISPVQISLNKPILICTEKQLASDLFSLSNSIRINSNHTNELFVYASADQDIRQYISDELLAELKSFIESTKYNIIFSVTSHGISFAILQPGGHRYLRPSVFKSAYTKQAAELYYRDLLFVTQITLLAAERASAVSV